MEQLVHFDPGLIFWTWTTFFVVLAILAWKAWRPMINALEKREAGIRGALEAAADIRTAINLPLFLLEGVAIIAEVVLLLIVLL